MFDITLPNYNTSRDEMIRMMQDVAASLGSNRLKSGEYDKVAQIKHYVQSKTIRREFGGRWFEATKAAGLVGQDMKVTRDELLENFGINQDVSPDHS